MFYLDQIQSIPATCVNANSQCAFYPHIQEPQMGFASASGAGSGAGAGTGDADAMREAVSVIKIVHGESGKSNLLPRTARAAMKTLNCMACWRMSTQNLREEKETSRRP